MHQWQQIALSIEPIPGATELSFAPGELSTFERTVVADNIVYKVAVAMAKQRLVGNQHEIAGNPDKELLEGHACKLPKKNGS